MTRRKARECGFMIIFEYEFQKGQDKNILLDCFYELNENPGEQKEYIDSLVGQTLSHISEIDALIEKHALEWKINRLSKVCLAALRIGICEMLFDSEIADSIAINEAVEIAKTYEDEKASGFVNGVLSSIYKEKGKSDEQ